MKRSLLAASCGLAPDKIIGAQRRTIPCGLKTRQSDVPIVPSSIFTCARPRQSRFASCSRPKCRMPQQLVKMIYCLLRSVLFVTCAPVTRRRRRWHQTLASNGSLHAVRLSDYRRQSVRLPMWRANGPRVRAFRRIHELAVALSLLGQVSCASTRGKGEPMVAMRCGGRFKYHYNNV